MLAKANGLYYKGLYLSLEDDDVFLSCQTQKPSHTDPSCMLKMWERALLVFTFELLSGDLKHHCRSVGGPLHHDDRNVLHHYKPGDFTKRCKHWLNKIVILLCFTSQVARHPAPSQLVKQPVLISRKPGQKLRLGGSNVCSLNHPSLRMYHHFSLVTL